MTDELKPTKTHNEFFTFIKDKVVFSFVATVFSGFSLFYLFGAALLWRYLKEQGLTGEFSLLLASNNLLMFFAFIGVLSGVLLSFYFLYTASLLKHVTNKSWVFKGKPKNDLIRTHFLFLFLPTPIILILKVTTGDWFNVFFPIIVFILFCIFMKYFWREIRAVKIIQLISDIEFNKAGYIAHIVFITLINFLPLLIIIKTVSSFSNNSDAFSFFLLAVLFALYVGVTILLSLEDTRRYMIMVVLLNISLMLFVLIYSNVPNNTAKHIGIGNYCTDITLKKDATIIQTLRDKSFLDPDPSLTLSNVYVLLHKHKDEYIVSKKEGKKGADAQRIPYANIEYSGFVNSCTDTD
jgi:hypothetical protein